MLRLLKWIVAPVVLAGTLVAAAPNTADAGWGFYVNGPHGGSFGYNTGCGGGGYGGYGGYGGGYAAYYGHVGYNYRGCYPRQVYVAPCYRPPIHYHHHHCW